MSDMTDDTDDRTGDSYPMAYWEGDTLILRASSFGGPCLWELAACAQGYEPTPHPVALQDRFEQGHELELTILGHYETKYGVKLSHTGDAQAEFEIRHPVLPVVVRCHPDALELNARPMVYDAKALSHLNFEKAKVQGTAAVVDTYRMQMALEMHGLATWREYQMEDVVGMWVAWDKEPDDPEASNKDRLHVEPVFAPPVHLDDIHDKMAAVYNAAIDIDVLDPDCALSCPVSSPSAWNCRFLPIRPTEDPSLDPSTEPPVDLDQAKVDELVRQYVHAKGQIDELDAKRKAASKALQDMAGGYRGRLFGHQSSCSVIEGSRKGSIDYDDLVADHPELAETIESYRKPKTVYTYISNAQMEE